jgi:Polyketide cyclase / dehydrase and lipid transport
MRLNTSATIDIAQPRDTVFDFACACETYVKLFRPRGSIAGVASAQILDGALRAGARRRMTLTDGAVIDEDVVAFDRPTRHTYRWTGGLRAPARFLVRGGEGDWTFVEHSGKTRIDWNYAFDLTTPLVYPAAILMLGQFRRWMEQQLGAISASLSG